MAESMQLEIKQLDYPPRSPAAPAGEEPSPLSQQDHSSKKSRPSNKKASSQSPLGVKGAKSKDDARSHVKQLQFPLSRVRTIMKCAPDVTNINQECVHIMTRAAESFVEDFARLACNQAAKSGRVYINYDDVADCIQSGDFKLRFLNDVIPQKILARDALQYYNKKVNGVLPTEESKKPAQSEVSAPENTSPVKNEVQSTS